MSGAAITVLGLAGVFGFNSGPSLLSALRDQLGLKLERTRGPIQFLIVDRAEKPPAN